jgi:hypothetical protein
MLLDLCPFWSLADITSRTRHVRFTSNSDRKSGHWQMLFGFPLRDKSKNQALP